MPGKEIWFQEPVNRFNDAPLNNDFSPNDFSARYHKYKCVQYFNYQNKLTMSVPMRPWFSAIRKIPDYIHLPAFFNITKQNSDKIDEKKRKRLEA